MIKILIADPDECFTSALRCRLSGYDIRICRTGAETIRILEEFHPDILVIRLDLPKTDGFSVLRKLPYRPRVMALTPIVNESVCAAASALGIDTLVPIPCTADHASLTIGLLCSDKIPSPEL